MNLMLKVVNGDVNTSGKIHSFASHMWHSVIPSYHTHHDTANLNNALAFCHFLQSSNKELKVKWTLPDTRAFSRKRVEYLLF